jgi:hypothetical protein
MGDKGDKGLSVPVKVVIGTVRLVEVAGMLNPVTLGAGAISA